MFVQFVKMMFTKLSATHSQHDSQHEHFPENSQSKRFFGQLQPQIQS